MYNKLGGVCRIQNNRNNPNNTSTPLTLPSINPYRIPVPQILEQVPTQLMNDIPDLAIRQIVLHALANVKDQDHATKQISLRGLALTCKGLSEFAKQNLNVINKEKFVELFIRLLAELMDMFYYSDDYMSCEFLVESVSKFSETLTISVAEQNIEDTIVIIVKVSLAAKNSKVNSQEFKSEFPYTKTKTELFTDVANHIYDTFKPCRFQILSNNIAWYDPIVVANLIAIKDEEMKKLIVEYNKATEWYNKYLNVYNLLRTCMDSIQPYLHLYSEMNISYLLNKTHDLAYFEGREKFNETWMHNTKQMQIDSLFDLCNIINSFLPIKGLSLQRLVKTKDDIKELYPNTNLAYNHITNILENMGISNLHDIVNKITTVTGITTVRPKMFCNIR